MSEKTEYGDWEPVIGLEIHVQLSTESKIFQILLQNSESNRILKLQLLTRPCILPVLNEKVIEMAVKFDVLLMQKFRIQLFLPEKNYFIRSA